MKTKRPYTDESRPGSAAESGLAHSETERQALRKQIRREMTGKRQSITRRREKEQAILRRLAPFVKGKTVAAYHAIGQEVDILQDDWLLPLTNPADHSLRFGTGRLRQGPYGIMEPDPDTAKFVEPEDIDVILVPMVAFDGLHRLGYGGGYYDRFLPRTKALKIGIAFREQAARFPVSAWDVDMDMVITDAGILTGDYNETDIRRTAEGVQENANHLQATGTRTESGEET